MTPKDSRIFVMLRVPTFLHALCLTLAVLAARGRALSNQIPLEHFFAEPDMRSFEVSPDGKYVAFLTTLGTGKVGIAMMDLATGKIEPLVVAKDENIKWFFWKNGSEYIVYMGDVGGNESAAIRSFNVRKRSVKALAESWVEVVQRSSR